MLNNLRLILSIKINKQKLYNYLSQFKIRIQVIFILPAVSFQLFFALFKMC